MDKYKDEEPQIAKITKADVKPGVIEVQWMRGSYSDTWVLCNSKRGPWLEEIPCSSVPYPVELSKTSRLTEPMRKKLKVAYSKM